VPARHRSRSSAPREQPPQQDTSKAGSEPEGILARVIASATALFADQGLGTTLADVASHADVGVATVYRRFATKDELIYEVYADRIRAAEELARKAAAEPDAWRGFVQFFEESIEILANDRGLRDLATGGYTRSLGWARGTAPDRLARLLSENNQTMGVHLTEVVRRAKKAGRLRRDFEATDMMVLSIAVQATILFGGTEHPDLYRRALGFILDGLHPSRRGVTPLPAPPLVGAELPPVRGHR
jgi:AcrR family transcriptional regulator